jgi:cytochrome c oxidase cbb3-type subunit 3
MRSSLLNLVVLQVAAGAALLGCDREERQLHAGAPSADPVYSVQLSTLVPVTQPSTQPSVTWSGPIKNSYEENAYAMSEGQRLYNAYNCVGCHAHGGGGMGPPLIDDQWIYGSQPQQVFSTIVQGRPNGMPAFGTKVPAYQIWQISAFVRSMSGLARFDAAPSRGDEMKNAPAPTTKDPEKPKDSGIPKSAEMPS